MNLLKLIFIFISLFNFSNGKNKYSKFEEENSGDDDMIMSDKMLMKMDMDENELRTVLFQNYSKFNIPVINVDDSVLLKYGIQIESLEYFNQVSENIKFNMLIYLRWQDAFLKWNKFDHRNHSHSNDYITIYSYQVWQPDLELYNSAEKPTIFDTKGALKLFSDGSILYNRATKYSFSCKLDFHNFPFDTQHCSMTFGSWKYTKKKLDLKPFDSTDLIKNISINKDFSHNEWNIIGTDVSHEDIEYLCCPGDLYPNTIFTISLKRNPQKYLIVIMMTIFITISDFFVSFISIDNYRRTFILVFIPLTLLWLQIYIASKIPVIEYSTLMEKIIATSFIITIINAVESAIFYLIFIYHRKLQIPDYKEVFEKKITDLNNTLIIFDYDQENINRKFITIIKNIDYSYKLIIIVFYGIYLAVIIN